MKLNKHLIWGFVFLVFTTAAQGAKGPASFVDKKFNFNVQNASLDSLLQVMSEKAGLHLELSGDFTNRVTYAFSDASLETVLQKIASDTGMQYSLEAGDKLVVRRAGKGRGIASIDDIQMLELKFVDVADILPKLTKYVGEGDDLQVDTKSNTLIFQGSTASFDRIKKFVTLLDVMPKQILIEAKIVETNDNFSRALGFNIGDTADNTLNNTSKLTAVANTKVPSSADQNFNFKYKFGTLNSRALDFRLTAAESNGDAKVISRPRVVTIDNQKASINSGIVFNVKTLTTQSTTSSTGTPTAVTGGVEQVTAGLTLNVLPRIVGEEVVRMLIDVNNSEPSSAYAVDGIPGVTNNAANTSIIIKEGNTAVIAGLIKNAKTNAETGVPILKDIPLLGLLFRSKAKEERNNELIILITPKILRSPVDMEMDKPEQKVDGAKDDKKEVAKQEIPNVPVSSEASSMATDEAEALSSKQ